MSSYDSPRTLTTTVLVTRPSSLYTDPVYRVVYTNLLYFVVMFLVPLAVLLILNGELIRVLRNKKAKCAQLLRGRTSLASLSTQQSTVDSGRCADVTNFIYYSPARHRDAASGIMFNRCYFLFFKCRPGLSTTGGRIATRIVALAPSMKKYYCYKFGDIWSNNPGDLVSHLHGW